MKEVGGQRCKGTGASTRELGMEELRQQEAAKSFVAAVKGVKAVTKIIVSQSVCKLVRSYKSKAEDLLWARKGVIVLVLNGEAIPIIQTRIADASFDDLDIIPFSAYKVYSRSVSNADVITVIAGFKCTKPVRWTHDVIMFERGAWVRIYGIPIHAWNTELFKLAIFECGIFLRLNDSTVAKDRFDYARVLLATSSLEVLNFSEIILIDG